MRSIESDCNILTEVSEQVPLTETKSSGGEAAPSVSPTLHGSGPSQWKKHNY